MLSTGGHAGGLALEAPITVLCVGCRNSLPAALSSHGLVIVFVALYGVGVGAGGRRRGASCGPRCPLALAAPGPSRDSGKHFSFVKNFIILRNTMAHCIWPLALAG